MEHTDLSNILCKLMKAHDVDYEMENEWIVPYGRLPAIRASWWPGEESGRLDIEVFLEDDRKIYECFAGFGSGNDGINNALENFVVNSYHVLLSAFWECHDPEQVEVEKWKIHGSEYVAYIGSIGTRASEGIQPHVPDSFFETIEKSIKATALEKETHWFRHFFCDIQGERTFESLKDNDTWQEGHKAIENLSWKKSTGYYSARNFLVLRAA